ncbi:MAG: GNAT family N-acetyltransferase [Gammaproteobacteria bacterium]|nr:GNAT family N-acetyltransferase [Gammaproteobacteria bacterium]MDH3410574.1 GNAT family N-acetyltransferase [Gammaproteobacteria bacterium]MDH3552773.1 GNAT family N-acetyltransferase [Gammaproteobacteria bacterium]
MQPEIEIREAGPADVESLSRIGHVSFRAAYEEWSEPDDLIAHLEDFFSPDAIRGEMDLPGHTYLIAIRDADPVGFVKIRENARPNEVPATRALELHQVYVLPQQQRFGIGGLLIAAAARYARDKAADGIWLSVWRDASWAVNCYRKYGFEEVGTTEFQLGRTVYSDLLMWRPAELTR